MAYSEYRLFLEQELENYLNYINSLGNKIEDIKEIVVKDKVKKEIPNCKEIKKLCLNFKQKI